MEWKKNWNIFLLLLFQSDVGNLFILCVQLSCIGWKKGGRILFFFLLCDLRLWNCNFNTVNQCWCRWIYPSATLLYKVNGSEYKMGNEMVIYIFHYFEMRKKKRKCICSFPAKKKDVDLRGFYYKVRQVNINMGWINTHSHECWW